MKQRYQGSLFAMPAAPVAQPQPAKVPPLPTKIAVRPVLGRCVRCGHDATLASPSGNPQSIYCVRCGKCKRKVYGIMKGVVVVRKECNVSMENFVKHPRLGMWCCPCLLAFEAEFEVK